MSLGVSFNHKGNFSKTENFFKKLLKRDYLAALDKYGQMGVQALSDATPKDTGETASSWSYEIEKNDKSTSIIFSNSNVNDGVNIAVILQYGHGTGNGGYVTGIDYINPAIRPIFDEIVKGAWKEVTDL